MSTRLLDKTRKLGNVLRNSSSNKACVSELARTVSLLIMGNVYLVLKDGIVEECVEVAKKVDSFSIGNILPEDINTSLLQFASTKENIRLGEIGLDENKDAFAIILPIETKNCRYASVIILRENDPFDIEDIIIAEYFSNALSLLLGNENNQKQDEKSRNLEAVKSALNSLSHKEYKAAKALFKELPIEGGLIVTSKISEEYEITRSIIINCISKLESAGIIESRSMGARGTNIKIKNPVIYDEVFKENVDI